MALHFIRRRKESWKSATALDRRRNDSIGLDFDAYPESWQKAEAWQIVDDTGECRYDMMFGSPDTAHIWIAGSVERIGGVTQNWLTLEPKADEVLERELARAVGQAKAEKVNRGTLLASIFYEER